MRNVHVTDTDAAGPGAAGYRRRGLAEHITTYHGYGWKVPLAPINGTLQAQASIMSYIDIFWLLGIVALCIWPLALFLPRMPKGGAPGH